MKCSRNSRFLPDLFVDTIYDIDTDVIKKKGIKVFVFDIDNTLAPYSVPCADDKLIKWVSDLKGLGFEVMLASNNGRRRVRAFAESIDCDYISRACKPLGFKIRRRLKRLNVDPSRAVLVGDQLFTDIWGASLMGMHSILVRAISEKEDWFVKFKRNIERRILSDSYKIYLDK